MVKEPTIPPAKNCETHVRTVSTPLNLPLFLSGRTRFRDDAWRKVPNYIEKKKHFYAKYCNEEKKVETRDVKDLKNMIGVNRARAERCTNLHITKITRQLGEDKAWNLPPNIYDTKREPYENKRGHLGSYWPKEAKKVTNIFEPTSVELARARVRKEQWKFYDLPTNADLLAAPSNQHKGVFLTNARDRRATARCMINEPSLVYRDPAEPSPAHYNPLRYQLAYNVSPPVYEPAPNPHLFLRRTSVPDKCLPLIRRHISFEPAVGRYDIRFPMHCACARKILTPGLRLIVDREKRLKFRRLPYKKLKTRNLCSPDWGHVKGRGFCRLFRISKALAKTLGREKFREKSKEKSKEKTEKVGKQFVLYPDSKYINMINSPRKDLISVHAGGTPKAPVRIRFNCIFRRVTRRQLRNNKKIVFNSGSERFPELEIRPVQLTVKQLEDLKNKLPPERQLRDYPITRRPLSQISSHLYDTPTHMRPAYEPALRKRLFKFRPLPEPKVLVSEKLFRSTNPEVQFFYNKPIVAENFMKDRRKTESSQHYSSIEISAEESANGAVPPTAEVPTEEAPTGEAPTGGA
ncbi:uncharacterized protein LOC105226301 [Bactrocera dorsalis]|uniref:Uncharacterized protein LOC105226301 n=1 Tax=Bactrocera dorsalis TaxID=27457 RepID=A0A6I9VIS3_BACDO|nr:uncharacterized protein LOC105226301 [Bactrocera dorsalis]